MENSALLQSLSKKRVPEPGLAIPKDVPKKTTNISKKIVELKKLQRLQGASSSKMISDHLKFNSKIVLEHKIDKGDQRNARKTVIDKTLSQPLNLTNDSDVFMTPMVTSHKKFPVGRKSRVDSSNVVKILVSPADRGIPHISPMVEAIAAPRELLNPPDNKKKWDNNALFENGVELAYNLIPVIPKQYRDLVHQWLLSLRKSKQSAVRNEYLAILLSQLKDMKLKKPFDQPPTKDPLKSLFKSRYPEIQRNAIESQCMLMDQLKLPLTPIALSGFKGNFQEPHKFLEDQPFPNNGIICYGACFSSQ